jgi:O-antigen/teichoic acid export membrane protein
MSYARRVAYNTTVQIVGRVLTTIVSLATVSLLNATLAPQGWGQYVAVTTYLGFFSVIADMGLNLLYLRELSRKPEQANEITAKYLGFRIMTATVVLFGLTPLIALAVPVYSAFLSSIMLLAVGQFFLTLNQMCVTVVQARLQMDRAMLSDFIGRVAILAGTVYAVAQAPAENRLLVAIGVVVIGNLVNLLVNLWLIRKMVRFWPTFAWREWPSIFVSVLPMGAMAVLGMIHFKADSVLLTLYRPEIEVGIYGNAYKILEILITLPAMFVGGLFPEMNQLIKQGGAALQPLLQKAFDLLIFAAIPVVTGLVLVAPQLIAILTRNHVAESAQSLQILAFAMVPLFLGTLMAHALLAVEKQKALSIVELVAVVGNIALNMYLIPRYSYFGAASATVATELLTTAITIWMVVRIVGFLPKMRTLWPALTGALAMVGVWRGAQLLGGGVWDTTYYDWARTAQVPLLLVVVAAGVFAYLLPFWMFRQFPPVIQERLYARQNRA